MCAIKGPRDDAEPIVPIVPIHGTAASLHTWEGWVAAGLAAATPEVQARLVAAGGEAAYLGANDFETFLRNDTERWLGFAKAIRK